MKTPCGLNLPYDADIVDIQHREVNIHATEKNILEKSIRLAKEVIGKNITPTITELRHIEGDKYYIIGEFLLLKEDLSGTFVADVRQIGNRFLIENICIFLER